MPAHTRVLVARDTPQHREVLSAMLRSSHVIGEGTLSTRVYRVTGAEWDEWSVADRRA